MRTSLLQIPEGACAASQYRYMLGLPSSTSLPCSFIWCNFLLILHAFNHLFFYSFFFCIPPPYIIFYAFNFSLPYFISMYTIFLLNFSCFLPLPCFFFHVSCFPLCFLMFSNFLSHTTCFTVCILPPSLIFHVFYFCSVNFFFYVCYLLLTTLYQLNDI